MCFVAFLFNLIFLSDLFGKVLNHTVDILENLRNITYCAKKHRTIYNGDYSVMNKHTKKQHKGRIENLLFFSRLKRISLIYIFLAALCSLVFLVVPRLWTWVCSEGKIGTCVIETISSCLCPYPTTRGRHNISSTSTPFH